MEKIGLQSHKPLKPIYCATFCSLQRIVPTAFDWPILNFSYTDSLAQRSRSFMPRVRSRILVLRKVQGWYLLKSSQKLLRRKRKFKLAREAKLQQNYSIEKCCFTQNLIARAAAAGHSAWQIGRYSMNKTETSFIPISEF